MKKLKHFGKRGLAVLIALVMCLSLLPMSAFAEVVTIHGGETKTKTAYDDLGNKVTLVMNPDMTPNDFSSPAYRQIGSDGKLNNFGGTYDLRVGEEDTFTRLPTNKIIGGNCGHIVAEYVPQFYLDFTATYEDGVITAPAYDFADVDGLPGLGVSFTGLIPGKTNVTVQYYVNFMQEAESGYCDEPIGYGRVCNQYTTIPADYTWHKYSDIFAVNVTADYTLTYTGEGVTTFNQTEPNVAYHTHSFVVESAPAARPGYVFKGWRFDGDGMLYEPYSTVTLDWNDRYGDKVEYEMTAVWEEDTGSSSSSKVPYNVNLEFYLNDDQAPFDTYTVEQPLSGAVGDKITGVDLKTNHPTWATWKNAMTYGLEAQEIEFAYQDSSPAEITLTEGVSNTITLKYVYKCADKGHLDFGGDDFCDVCGGCMHGDPGNDGHCNNTNCDHEGCEHCGGPVAPHTHEYTWEDNKDGTHNEKCSCGDVKTANELHTYDENGKCYKCGAVKSVPGKATVTVKYSDETGADVPTTSPYTTTVDQGDP